MTLRGASSRVFWPVLLAALTPLAAGCMRMSRGSLQMIDVQTNPPGAKVAIRPALSDFETPGVALLSRKPPSIVNVSEPGYSSAAYIVTASKPGYKDASVPIESRISRDMWIRNLIWIHPLFYGIGILVDTTSGAGYELRPSNILLVLEPETGTK